MPLDSEFEQKLTELCSVLPEEPLIETKRDALRDMIDDINDGNFDQLAETQSSVEECSSKQPVTKDFNVSYVFPEHLKIFSKSLLAQRAVLDYYKNNTDALNQLQEKEKELNLQISTHFF
jgi:hypothetical protein